MPMAQSLQEAVQNRLRTIGELSQTDQRRIVNIVNEKLDELNAAAADPTVDLWQATQSVLARIQTEEAIAGLKLARRARVTVFGIVFDAIKFGVAFV